MGFEPGSFLAMAEISGQMATIKPLPLSMTYSYQHSYRRIIWRLDGQLND
jgi:hypothetical protein